MFAATDLDDHLVQMPSRTWFRRGSAWVAGDQAAKLQEPPPNGLVRNVYAPFRQHFLDITEGEREAGIEPDSVDDYRRWKAMALEGYRLNPSNPTARAA